ncbi:DEKNAAC100490 [Brettanomyces naardenensis]|uniref:DEKNAAC100490 n=1 Tax=Brettanomyces naardenensis TaxID=13370 RepID=A0A448YFL6_BRENA|nr:DEKNAAC100490 [Brettanomyces naardenensis]
MDDVHADVRTRYEKLTEPYMDCTFKFEVVEYQGAKKAKKEQIRIIDSFKYLGLRGKIRLSNPAQVFTVLQSYSIEADLCPRSEPDYCWFGRQVGLSARSHGIVDRYEIAKRPYFGTTTFESELSLVTCNLALVKEGQLVYDPFVGTGSFALAAGHFGGYTFGSDIDFLALKGGRPGQKDIKRLKDNFKHYGTQTKFGDVLCMDFTNSALRKDLIVDTIVCDPPYGIREGLRVCGTTNLESAKLTENKLIDGEKAFLRREYVQPKKPCTLDFMLDDLLRFSAERLPVGGRLCFWMPAADDEDIPRLIPQHEKLELIYVLEQSFYRWSRRLLVYVKRDGSYTGKTVTKEERAHENNFRERYFNRFI